MYTVISALILALGGITAAMIRCLFGKVSTLHPSIAAALIVSLSITFIAIIVIFVFALFKLS